MTWLFAPGHVLENFLDVRFSVFRIHSLLLRVRVVAMLFVFFLKRCSLGPTGHTPHSPFGPVPFYFLSLRRLFIHPFWPVAPRRVFAVCRVAILGPRRLGVFRILSEFWGA